MKTIGMIAGWLVALGGLAIGYKDNPGAWDLVCFALFIWGTLCAMIVGNETRDQINRYEKALRANGIDPKTCY